MSSRAELNEAIEVLRQEIAGLDNSDAATREQLLRLTNMMQEQLDEPSEPNNGVSIDNIKDAISTYEAKHPRFTAMANELMTRLAAMGI